MYPAVLSLCMYSTLCAVPDRPSPDEPNVPDVEARWYDQLRREGSLTVNLDIGGRIVIVPNGIVNRKLLDVVITRYDDKGNALFMARADEVELRLNATKRFLVLTFDKIHITSLDCGFVHVMRNGGDIHFALLRAR